MHNAETFARASGVIPIDPARAPIGEHLRVYDAEIQEAASAMIRSISGWRAVFASDGQTESKTPSISAPMQYLASAMALSYTRLLAETGRHGRVLVACDGRPTGPAIADVMIRAFLYLGREVDFAGVLSSPHATALAAADSRIAGLAYITASHNPPGYNGVKWTDEQGRVLSGAEAKRLSEILDSVVTPWEFGESLRRLVVLCPKADVFPVVESQARVIERADAAYRDSVVTRAGRGVELSALKPLLRPVTVVADYNGGARGTGIDGELLGELGATLYALHPTPGDIAHTIEPEGAALDECRAEIESRLAGEEPVLLGYVADNDGDRGNLVFPLPRSQHAPAGASPAGPETAHEDSAAPSSLTSVLESQHGFSLALIAELAWIAARGYTGRPSDTSPEESCNLQTTAGDAAPRASSPPAADAGPHASSPPAGHAGPRASSRPAGDRKPAIVVNGATSLRIEEIAARFGVTVFRCEVGEINVVTAAERLRGEGWFVPFAGEGSNGGNITTPGTIRDPISTVISMLRLLALRPEAQTDSSFRQLLPGGHPLLVAMQALAGSDHAHTESAGRDDKHPTQAEHHPIHGGPPPDETGQAPGWAQSGSGSDAGREFSWAGRESSWAARTPSWAQPGVGPESSWAGRESSWAAWDAGLTAAFSALNARLPAWTTTPVTSPDARIEVGPVTHEELKTRLESLLPEAVADAYMILDKHTGITPVRWEIRNFEGIECRIGAGSRDPDGDGTGGFAVWFVDATEKPFAFTWMRGSRTEPVFRTLADLRGGSEAGSSELLQWFQGCIRRAEG
ncbi:MAG: hypothetical protein ACLFM0_01900 [Spirochaetales bacterium]